MRELRRLGGGQPTLSLELATAGNLEFPDSPDAAERAFIIAKSLTNLNRFEDAREQARQMLKAYPNSPFSADVERHLLSVPFSTDRPRSGAD